MLFLDYLSLPTLIDKIMAQVIKIVRDGGWGGRHADGSCRAITHPLLSYPLWLRAVPKQLN